MVPPEFLRQWFAMSVGVTAVSKRSSRMYFEDETEKDAGRYSQASRVSIYDETTVETTNRKNSSCISTSQTIQTSQTSQSSRQTSLEVSPHISAGVDRTVEMVPPETLSLDVHGEYDDAIKVFGSVQGYNAFASQGPHKILPAAGRPLNFGTVVSGVYRSSFPQTEDYGFIEGLNLKTVVTLVQKDFPPGYEAFMKKNSIKHHVFDMKGTKKENIPINTMKSILRIVLDQQNHPLLIHCNHGKHRTGCVVAVVRKVTGWELGRIVDEYKDFAEPKIRECDIKYITTFQLADISNLFRDASWQYRTRSFARATVFALFVLVVWIFSGARIAETPKRELAD